jgi:hypothetical protein
MYVSMIRKDLFRKIISLRRVLFVDVEVFIAGRTVGFRITDIGAITVRNSSRILKPCVSLLDYHVVMLKIEN